ncbi:hypothetical protein N8D56_13690 [Devosia sp. A8/3-2]|nr:hypothetical protein N8D56_13690 [Devosia sp. A8/3-2]
MTGRCHCAQAISCIGTSSAGCADNTKAARYDLGGTDGYQGLHQFKKGMVGDAGVIRPVPPVANYASNPLAYLLGTGAFNARDAYYQLRRVVDAWRNPKARPDQAPQVSTEGRG